MTVFRRTVTQGDTASLVAREATRTSSEWLSGSLFFNFWRHLAHWKFLYVSSNEEGARKGKIEKVLEILEPFANPAVTSWSRSLLPRLICKQDIRNSWLQIAVVPLKDSFGTLWKLHLINLFINLLKSSLTHNETNVNELSMWLFIIKGFCHVFLIIFASV